MGDFLNYAKANATRIGHNTGAVLTAPSALRRFIGDTFGDIYQREKVEQLLRETGLQGGVRISVEWFEVERQAGIFDFDDLIAVCKTLKKYSIPVCITIFNSNTVAYPSSDLDKRIGFTNSRMHNVIADLRDLETSKVWRYWNAIIDNLGPFVRYFTFENEPELGNINGLRFNQDGTLVDPQASWVSQDYAMFFKLLIARFKLLISIKEREKGYELYAGGATYTNDQGYIPNGFSHDLGISKSNADWLDIFDFLDIHDYPRIIGNRYFHPEAIFRDHYELEEKIEANRTNGKVIPVTLTEFGFSAGIGKSAYMERVQAGFVVRHHLMNLLQGILHPNTPFILGMQYHFHDVLPWVFNLHNSAANPQPQDARYGAFVLRENYDGSVDPHNLEFQKRELGNILTKVFGDKYKYKMEHLIITAKDGEILYDTTDVKASTHPNASAIKINVTTVVGEGRVATLTTDSVHNLNVGDTVSVTGAANPAFNGFVRVSSVPSTTSFTYSTSDVLTASSSGAVKVNLAAGPFTSDIRGFSHYYTTRFDASSPILGPFPTGSPIGIPVLGGLLTTATATTSAPHGFNVGDKVFIEGALTSSFNGTQTITSVPSATQFTYETTNPNLPSSTGGVKTVTALTSIPAFDIKVTLSWEDYQSNAVTATADITIIEGMTPATLAQAIATEMGDKAYVSTLGNKLFIAPISHGLINTSLTITDSLGAELTATRKEALGIRSASSTVDEIRLVKPIELGNFEEYPKGSTLWLFRQLQGSYTEPTIGSYMSGELTRGTGPNGEYTKVLRDPIFDSIWNFFFRDTENDTVHCLSYRMRDWRHGYGDLGYSPICDQVHLGIYERKTADLHSLASSLYPDRNFDGEKYVRVSMWPRWVNMVEI